MAVFIRNNSPSLSRSRADVCYFVWGILRPNYRNIGWQTNFTTPVCAATLQTDVFILWLLLWIYMRSGLPEKKPFFLLYPHKTKILKKEDTLFYWPSVEDLNLLCTLKKTTLPTPSRNPSLSILSSIKTY